MQCLMKTGNLSHQADDVKRATLNAIVVYAKRTSILVTSGMPKDNSPSCCSATETGTMLLARVVIGRGSAETGARSQGAAL
jgi:hypothetical protein